MNPNISGHVQPQAYLNSLRILLYVSLKVA